ncbi:hypothetical protein GF325_14740, partial [Candidatus Bathyarchaeota archaeon]|nr:hypothetical protein [Candidatus Bathyarchaeota archaeon]
MALVKSPDKDEIESVDKVPKYQVTPRYGGWLIDDKFILEVALPGVSKDNIQIKALQDYFTLRATRENIQYVLDLNLNFRIEPEKVTTKFVE